MSVSDSDIAFALELFAEIPAITTRKMMGGLCIYSEGTIFALLFQDGVLYLKAKKGPFAAKLSDLGCEQWTYTRDTGKVTSMPYWTLPGEALDDPEMACDLAREALTHLED